MYALVIYGRNVIGVLTRAVIFAAVLASRTMLVGLLLVAGVPV